MADLEGRLAAARAEVQSLKGQLKVIKEEKNAILKDESKELDWEDVGKSDAHNFDFKPRRNLRGHMGKVYAMQWGNAKNLVSASQDGKLIVWSADLEAKLNLVTLKMAWVMTCAYEQSAGQLVACGGLDNICSVYKLKPAGNTISRAEAELRGHDGYLSCCRFRTPTEILTCSGDSTCCLWDIERQEKIGDFTDHAADVMSVSISPTNPNIFCSGSIEPSVKIWDIRASSSSHCTQTFVGHESDVNAVDFFPDGNAVGTGSEDASCNIYDLRAHGALNKFSDEQAMLGIFSVSFSKSGRLLFAGYEEHMCYAWETISNEGVYHALQGHSNRVSTVGVNTDGNALCTGSWDQTLMVWA